MKIAMFGNGYVGFVSGVCFSDFGHDVIGVDKMPEKTAMLNACEVSIYAPGLNAVMAQNVAAGRLNFTTNSAAAVDGADEVSIAIGPSTRRGDVHTDLPHVIPVAEDIANALLASKIRLINGIATVIEPHMADLRSILDQDGARTARFDAFQGVGC